MEPRLTKQGSDEKGRTVFTVDYGPRPKPKKGRNGQVVRGFFPGQVVSVGPYPAKFLSMLCRALRHKVVPLCDKVHPATANLWLMESVMKARRDAGHHIYWEISGSEHHRAFMHRTANWRLQVKISEQAWQPRQKIELNFSTLRAGQPYRFLYITWIGSAMNPQGNWYIREADTTLLGPAGRWDRIELLYIIARQMERERMGDLVDLLYQNASSHEDARFTLEVAEQFSRWESGRFPERCHILVQEREHKRRNRPRKRTRQSQNRR